MRNSDIGLHGKNKQAQKKITNAYVGMVIVGTEVYVSSVVDPDLLGSTNYLHVRSGFEPVSDFRYGSEIRLLSN
jgi:hypothetical protein